MIGDIAGWIAPGATIVAAMMTAANLSARVTGWGFVVFTIGSIGWSLVGLGSGQTNLVATNIFLTLVNGIGVWRWLGRQLRYEEGGRSAKVASRRSTDPALFTATGVAGMAVTWRNGRPAGRAIEALIECSSGQISYVVVATAEKIGLVEHLRAVPRAGLNFDSECLKLQIAKAEFDALPLIEDSDWPSAATIPTRR